MKQANSYDLRKYLNVMDLPMGPKSRTYLVDMVNGSDLNTGTNLDQPLKTLEEAEDRCVGDQHDAVLVLSGDTADNPSAAIVWDKDYTHLVGLSSGVFGLGQRCRVVAQAAVAASPVITFSSNGCIVRNIQFNNEKAAGVASGVGIITGSRNHYKNVFWMTPTATDAESYSLKLSGSENVFERCTIGQYTNARSAASYGLWLHGATAVSRNHFVKSSFLSWGALDDHVLVLVDADIVTYPWMTIFEDCLFANNAGGGDTLTQAIDDNSTAAGHQILLLGKNSFAGVDAVADTLTYILVQHFSHGGLMAALEESAET
jgi:hypothetical protein